MVDIRVEFLVREPMKGHYEIDVQQGFHVL